MYSRGLGYNNNGGYKIVADSGRKENPTKSLLTSKYLVIIVTKKKKKYLVIIFREQKLLYYTPLLVYVELKFVLGYDKTMTHLLSRVLLNILRILKIFVVYMEIGQQNSKLWNSKTSIETNNSKNHP